MSSWKETPVLQNGLVSRSLAIGENGAFTTTSLLNRRTGKEFLVEAGDVPISREFSIRWRDQWLCGHRVDTETQDFIFLRSSLRTERPGTQRLEIYLATPAGDLQVQFFYEIYDQYPVIRKWLTITNSDKLPGRLDQVAWEDLAIRVANPSDMEIGHGIEALRPDSQLAHLASCHLGILYDSASRQSLVAVNEEPGASALIAMNGADENNLKITFSKSFAGVTLEPNQTFQTASATLLMANEDSPNQKLSAVLPDYFRYVLSRRMSEPRIVYVSGSAIKTDQNVLSLTPDAHFGGVLGFTTLCIQGGGFCRPGGFDVDLKAVPGGLGHAAKLLDERQMELGISIPLAALDPECAVAQEHPEWICRDKDGDMVALEFEGEKRLMACLASGYSAYLLEEIRKLYTRDNLRLVHLVGPCFHVPDGSIGPCHAAEHRHNGPAGVTIAIGRHLTSLLHNIAQQCPDLALGLDHDVLGNGDLDPSLLLVADFLRISRIPEQKDRRNHLEARRVLYRHAMRFPSERLVLGDMRLDGRNPVATVATALGAFPLFTGSTSRLAPGQLDWMRGILDWYFALSRGINFYERFYLLHGTEDARASHWDGYARLSRRGEGFAAVFRNGAASSMERFGIPGLDTAAQYRIDSIIRDRALGIFPGSDLVHGFPFELAHEDGADLIEIRRVQT